ncbi:MAG: T9SS type A sorting domain-containing protein [Bacteroidetes bacterium]|nr:T9SS type A sorting domain-containing protein [Bacteroidota bacterium]
MLNTAIGQLKFNREGNKVAFCSYKGTLELFDFDRCSGTISNPELIYLENNSGPWPSRFSCEFSSNSEYLYVSNFPDSSFIYQYDLNASNIALSETLIWYIPKEIQRNSGGQLKLAPDNKIYFSSVYYNGFFPYPYPDTVYNMYNMNLGVINSPDSLGAACDFQPYSFYLGGKRTYWGLPNNPDFDLGSILGSPCDTLVGIAPPLINILDAEILVYYDIGWQAAFINGHHLKGTKQNLKVYDISGKIIFEENGKLNPPYYTKNLNCTGWAKGMYVVIFETDKEKLTKKFVIE